MLLTVSKRLEFSAARRLHVNSWSDTENLAVFGPETNSRHGTGRNYVAYFVFTGPVNPSNGMLINISEIKERAGKIVRERFDHKFLNKDDASFRDVPPTAENIARHECRGERAAVWPGYFNSRTQLSRSSHFSNGTLR